MRQTHPATASDAQQAGFVRGASPGTDAITLAVPTAADASAVHDLVSACKPLDVNSTYAYLLLCHHYAQTCVVAKAGKRVVGFISGYLLPDDAETLFVWQVAVHPDTRGARLGVRMLQHLLQRERVAAARFMETTVSPSNEASRRMFCRFADSLHAQINEKTLFERSAFGNEEHEEEVLLKIGPLDMINHREKEEIA